MFFTAFKEACSGGVSLLLRPLSSLQLAQGGCSHWERRAPSQADSQLTSKSPSGEVQLTFHHPTRRAVCFIGIVYEKSCIVPFPSLGWVGQPGAFYLFQCGFLGCLLGA